MCVAGGQGLLAVAMTQHLLSLLRGNRLASTCSRINEGTMRKEPLRCIMEITCLLQVWEGAAVAGSLSQLVWTRMDAARFIGVNTARGPWSLIQDLSTTSAKPAALPAPAAPVAGLAGSMVQAPTARHALPSIGLEQVQQIVAQAAASVLGTDAEGEVPPCC